MEFVMLTAARMLSVLSGVSTVVFTFIVIGVGRLNLLHLGFEATGVAASLSLFSAALAALLALVIVIVVRLKSGTSAGVAQVALTAAISLLVLGVVGVMGLLPPFE
jgi:hypothetical protein